MFLYWSKSQTLQLFYATAAASVWVVFCCILFVQCLCVGVLWVKTMHAHDHAAEFYLLYFYFLPSRFLFKVHRFKIAMFVNVFWKMFLLLFFTYVFFLNLFLFLPFKSRITKTNIWFFTRFASSHSNLSSIVLN